MNELRLTFGLDHFEAMVDEVAAREILDIAVRSAVPRLHEKNISEEIDKMIHFGISPDTILACLREEQCTDKVMDQLRKKGLLHERT